jgi:hypothetical protein
MDEYVLIETGRHSLFPSKCVVIYFGQCSRRVLTVYFATWVKIIVASDNEPCRHVGDPLFAATLVGLLGYL